MNSGDNGLKDQSQVYLPINNALSPVGHVHGFIEELGQGVQHVASRVGDLISFIQRANDYRKVTGEGFTFLNIPRSYYGVLQPSNLLKTLSGSDLLSLSDATDLFKVCESSGVCTALTGEVDLSITRPSLRSKIASWTAGKSESIVGSCVEVIMRARYCNLYSLLRDHMSESSYIFIVTNKILVDVQGEDLLFQIFTSNILQECVGDESPFFEYIQRVCSECLGPDGCPAKVKPGCGGFGIRNFLTLFLSIEVSKAMQDVKDCTLAGDSSGVENANTRVSVFTDQLNEANPILTDISDAMTAEGKFVDMLAGCEDSEKKKELEAKRDEQAEKKKIGNERLMECSLKYRNIMRSGNRQRVADKQQHRQEQDIWGKYTQHVVQSASSRCAGASSVRAAM
jgi:hypothetical protein